MNVKTENRLKSLVKSMVRIKSSIYHEISSDSENCEARSSLLVTKNFRRTKKETNKVALQEHLLSKRKLSRPTINQRS